MRLLRVPEPFDHSDWLYEVKFDGFRALAHVTGHHCQLVSRNGHVFKSWPYLAEEIAHSVRAVVGATTARNALDDSQIGSDFTDAQR
jgi:ATP-dependent DNA ligase